MKPLRSYEDFRRYLLDHAEEKRTRNRRWTLGVWARQIGLGSTTSLTMILNGQRNPGPAITQKLIRYFAFDPADRDYFLDLVQLAKLRTNGPGQQRMKVLLTRDLRNLSPSGPSRKVDARTFFAISQWYNYAIRQMTLLKGFNGDLEWIRSRLHFPITAPEIDSAIDTLVGVGLLRRGPNGGLRRIRRFLKTDDDVASEGLKSFHEGMIRNALKAVRKFGVDQRELGGLTLAIPEESLQEGKQLIRRFLDEFEKLGGKPGADRVFQLNIQFFPLAESDPARVRPESPRQSGRDPAQDSSTRAW